MDCPGCNKEMFEGLTEEGDRCYVCEECELQQEIDGEVDEETQTH